MENTPKTNSEQNQSDEDKDKSEKKKTKKTSVIPRHVPLGISIEKSQDRVKDKPKILSIGEGLLQQLKPKTEEKIAETDEKEPADKLEITEEPDKAIPVEDMSPYPATDLVTKEKAVDSDEVVVPDSTLSEEKLAAADWAEEGELNDDSEIDLTSHHSVAEETANEEPPAEFTEVPIESPPDLTEEPEVVEPELLDNGLGAEKPPDPPEDEPPAAIEPPESPIPPERGAGFGWYDAAAADRLARDHEEAVNEAEYRGEKRGNRRGVAAGLFFGWLFGRHGKKKAEKAHLKELKTKDKEIANLTREQIAARDRIESIKRTQEQIQSNIQKEGIKQALEPKKEAKRAFEGGTLDAGRHLEKAKMAESNLAKAFVSKEITHDKQTTKEVSSIEKLPEDQEITEDTYKTKEGSHVETSAWHRIEIDEKTGKPINNPEVAYGKEFEREQRQERLREDRKLSGAGVPASVLGGLAASSAASSTSTSTQSGTVSQDQEGSLQVDKPIVEEHQHLNAGNELLHYASHPLTWVIAAIIVIALFAIGALR